MDHGCTDRYGPGTTRSHVRVVQEAGAVPEGGETDDQLGEDGPSERPNLDEYDTSAGAVPAPTPLRAGCREPGVAENIEGRIRQHLRRDPWAGASGTETWIGGGPGAGVDLGGEMDIELD